MSTLSPLGSDYCQNQVRKFDRDRYLTTLFAPADRRQGLFALYAFNYEVAKVSDVVSEPMLGHIRLQWWREAIDGIYSGSPRKHQIVEALATTINNHDLPRAPFDELIDAREADLEEQGPQTLQPWLDYVEATSSTLVSLSLSILGVQDETTHMAGKHVGVAWALTGLLRAAPGRAERNQSFMSTTLTDPSGMNRKVAAIAIENLWAARRYRSQIPKTALPALLPAVIASRYLRRLNHGEDMTKGITPLDQLILYGHALTGRY